MDSLAFDPRLTPARSDIAAHHLKGKVEAARFVSGQPANVRTTSAQMRFAPDPAAQLETELLFGEPFTVYDTADGWSWGQAGLDGYVGYVPATALDTNDAKANRLVRHLRTFVYSEPDKKSPAIGWLSIGSRVSVLERTDRFSVLAGGGYVYSTHLAPTDDIETDILSVALRFLGTPYLWGGRTSHGLDCSALVQLSCQRCGIACPRDSDMQERALGAPIDTPDLMRGDFVFWNGHVGIMVDETHVLHANGWHMAVTVDPLTDFSATVLPIDGPISSVRRL